MSCPVLMLGFRGGKKTVPGFRNFFCMPIVQIKSVRMNERSDESICETGPRLEQKGSRFTQAEQYGSRVGRTMLKIHR